MILEKKEQIRRVIFNYDGASGIYKEYREKFEEMGFAVFDNDNFKKYENTPTIKEDEREYVIYCLNNANLIFFYLEMNGMSKAIWDLITPHIDKTFFFYCTCENELFLDFVELREEKGEPLPMGALFPHEMDGDKSWELAIEKIEPYFNNGKKDCLRHGKFNPKMLGYSYYCWRFKMSALGY